MLNCVMLHRQKPLDGKLFYITPSHLTFIILLLFLSLCQAVNEEFIAKMEAAKAATSDAIHNIRSEWQVDLYPNFLKSCSMHKSAWEFMKNKLMQRILEHEVPATKATARKEFVISFLGSSVAAGHDSFFNQSYPIVVGNILAPVFQTVGLSVDSRNVALGNNPCMPYDICVKIFAGLDADIVHWEQTYNCGDKPILEQFVRQAMTIPTQPIIVFSESFTAHWNADKCNPTPPNHVLTDVEKELLSSTPLRVVSEMNKDEFKRAWNILHDISKSYRGAGIQTFTHSKHEVYACLGPYIKDWEKGAAAWHPSVIAHKLRASHHSYWWLVCLKEAIDDLISLGSHRPLEGMLKDVTKHIASLHRPLPKPIHNTVIVDNMQCHSDYEPRYVREASLKKIVLQGLASDGSVGWKSNIYEDLVHENLVKQSIKMGYKDFKHLLWAEGNSGPLSLLLNVTKSGPTLVCETPGIWGALPEGFKHLWESNPDIHITLNVHDAKGFVFIKDKAEKYDFSYDKEYEICIKLNKELPVGQHVLTLSPNPAGEKIILAWIVLP